MNGVCPPAPSEGPDGHVGRECSRATASLASRYPALHALTSRSSAGGWVEEVVGEEREWRCDGRCSQTPRPEACERRRRCRVFAG